MVGSPFGSTRPGDALKSTKNAKDAPVGSILTGKDYFKIHLPAGGRR